MLAGLPGEKKATAALNGLLVDAETGDGVKLEGADFVRWTIFGENQDHFLDEENRELVATENGLEFSGRSAFFRFPLNVVPGPASPLRANFAVSVPGYLPVYFPVFLDGRFGRNDEVLPSFVNLLSPPEGVRMARGVAYADAAGLLRDGFSLATREGTGTGTRLRVGPKTYLYTRIALIIMASWIRNTGKYQIIYGN